MFSHFFYALLGFRVREFPAKSEKTSGYLLLREGCILKLESKIYIDDYRTGIRP